MKASAIARFVPVALLVSTACLANAETIKVEKLLANPKAYVGKQFGLICTLRSADLASVYCNDGGENISLGSRSMDKPSLKFALANCNKPDDAKNSPKCKDVPITATLKDAARPKWLDNVKMKLK